MKKTALILFGFGLAFVACQKDVVETKNEHKTTPQPLETPYGFAEPDIPADNPQTKEGIFLGRRLFFEKRLSGDNSLSCGGCHFQDNNFGDPNQFSTGIDGSVGDKNAMILSNLAWQEFFFWDGRKSSLEEQILDPVENPIEMKSSWPEALNKLKADPNYQKWFKAAFGENAITKENAAKAIAQFLRTMVSANSKYDKGLKTGFSNFTQIELDGMDLFETEDGDCFHCHGAITTASIFGAYGETQFSNNGLDSIIAPNTGLEAVTGNPDDRGKFKIPSLRNVEYSFPYMHDGRFVLLRDVIKHYSTGVKYSPTLDNNLQKNGTLEKNFSEYQINALLAFLQTLSDEEFITDTTFTDPW